MRITSRALLMYVCVRGQWVPSPLSLGSAVAAVAVVAARQVHADVVVAADGSRSAVRKLLNMPHDEPNDVGLRILGGTVTDVGQLDSFPKGAGSLMIMGRGSSLFVGRYSADGDDGVEGEATGSVYSVVPPSSNH